MFAAERELDRNRLEVAERELDRNRLEVAERELDRNRLEVAEREWDRRAAECGWDRRAAKHEWERLEADTSYGEYSDHLAENEWRVSSHNEYTDNCAKLWILRSYAPGYAASPQEAKVKIDQIFRECDSYKLFLFYIFARDKLPVSSTIPFRIIKEKNDQCDYFSWEYFKLIRHLDIEDFKFIQDHIYKENGILKSKAQIQGILRLLMNKDDYKKNTRLLYQLIEGIIINFESVSDLIEQTSKNERIQIGMMLANYASDELELEIFSMLNRSLTPKKRQEVIQIIFLEKVRHNFINHTQFEIESLLYDLKKEGWRDLIWNKNIKKRKLSFTNEKKD